MNAGYQYSSAAVVRAERADILNRVAALIDRAHQCIAESDIAIARSKEAAGLLISHHSGYLAQKTVDPNLVAANLHREQELVVSLQPLANLDEPLDSICMKVTLAAKCRNHNCAKTVVVADGREASPSIMQSARLNLDFILDLAHYAICSHCGLGQVFRERELRPLLS